MKKRLALAACLIVAAACGNTRDSLGGSPSSPASSALAAPTPTACRDPIKCSTLPAGRTPQPPRPCDSPLTTADEIRAAAVQMSVSPGQTAPLGSLSWFGDPVLVHGLRIGDPDEWLVPVIDGAGGASQVVLVEVRSNGRGCAGMSSGWSGAFPRISEDAARRRGDGPNDPVATIEAIHLPWTRTLPPSSNTNLVWRIVRMSGYELYLFDGGELYAGDQLRTILAGFGGAHWRGEPVGATPRPPWSPPQRYPVATAHEVLVGLASDTFYLEYVRYLRDQTPQRHPPVDDPHADTPVRAHGLEAESIPRILDLWIVPVRDRSGAVVSIVTVPIDEDGSGSASSMRGWSGAFPVVSESQARILGSTPGDPAVSAALAWAPEYLVSPGGTTAPFWLVTRQSGVRVVVTEARTLLSSPR